jgi:hypothetical protein
MLPAKFGSILSGSFRGEDFFNISQSEKRIEEQLFFSDWLLLKKSSPLKLLGQMEPNLAGSIYVRSSIKFLRFVPFGQQIWPPRAILFSDWLMLKKSSPPIHRCFLPSLAPFGQAVSEEKIFLTVANQKKELLLVAMFVGQMEPYEEAL